MNRALDCGINFIDTARVYGASEEIIGRVLSRRRDEFILCSKVLSYFDQKLSLSDLRRKITESLEESLRALKTGHIDVLMIHSAPAEVIVAGDVISVLEDLRPSGKFTWIGASTYGEQAALEALRSNRYDCLQIATSAIDRRLERIVLPEAKQRDIGIVARSVLLKGVLTPRYHFLPDHLADLKAAAAKLETVAAAAGMSLPEIAYRYVLGQNPPQTALVGASSVEEVEAAVRCADAGPLPPEMMAATIREVTVENENLLNPGTWGVG